MIMVLGGNGYIGRVLMKMLPDALCWDKNFLTNCQGTDIRTVTEDRLKWLDIDCVIDLACISNDPCCELDPKLTEDINITGALRVARMAKKAGVKRYIYSSTCSVYGEGAKLNLTEKSPVNPLTAYAKSKLFTEQALLKMNSKNFKVVALRNGTVFGLSPSMRFDLVVNQMTMNAWLDGKITVNDGSQYRPCIHIKDVCDAFITMIDNDVTGVYNTGGVNYTIHEIACKVRQVMMCEMCCNHSATDKRNYSVNSSKAAKIGIYPKRSLYEGIVEIKQALDNGLDPYDPRTVRVKWYKLLQKQGKI